MLLCCTLRLRLFLFDRIHPITVLYTEDKGLFPLKDRLDKYYSGNLI